MAVPADPPTRLDRAREVIRSLWARRWLRRSFIACAVLAVLGFVSLVWAYAAISLPATPETAQTTVVLDAEGNVLAELFDEENRASVTLDQVSPIAIEAVIAAEDRGFYRHGGLNPFSIGRAFLADIRGERLQGGSTITQQLVKNTWLTPERSLTRKVKEAILSIKVEREWSKEEILERYLNTVYFGRGAYGIEKAAQVWFEVPASQLDLAQAALLAGLIRAPESADPASDPEAATARRQIVLDALVKNGKVTEAEAQAAADTPIEATPRVDDEARLTGSHAYFVAQVRQWLVQRYGESLAFGGGLQVTTTLRPTMQAAADEAVKQTLGQPDDPDAALVALDDRGAIVAMIGGRDFAASKVNLAMGEQGGGTGRQPGSTFKPFVLATALEEGIPVMKEYLGPPHIDVEVGGVPFPVDNYANEAFGALTLADATAKSVNTIYAQLMAEVGPENVAELAMDLGVTATIEPHPSIALGTEEVSPLDMARSFMTFANRGDRITPFFVEKVADRHGAVIYTASVDRERVYPRQYADVVNHVLQNAVEHGTGRAASIGRPVAGKTGTTQDNTDAWFVGYTPKIGAAVWMGYKDGTDRKMDSVHGRSVTGGSFPAQIWQRFMSAATAGIDTGTFTEPPADLLAPPPTSSTTTSSTSSTSSTTSSTSSTSTSSTTSTTDPDDDTTTTTEPDDETTTTTEPDTETSTTTTTIGDGTDSDGGGGRARPPDDP